MNGPQHYAMAERLAAAAADVLAPDKTRLTNYNQVVAAHARATLAGVHAQLAAVALAADTAADLDDDAPAGMGWESAAEWREAVHGG